MESTKKPKWVKPRLTTYNEDPIIRNLFESVILKEKEIKERQKKAKQ